MIDKYIGTRSNRYLILAAIAICYAGQFKIFITLQILAVLAMLTLWEVYKDRKNIATNTIFRLFAATMVVFEVMYFPTILDSLRDASLVKMELQLFTSYIPDTIKNLGMTNIPPIDSLYAVYVNKDIGPISALLLISSVLVYTIFSFGLRIVAFPYMSSEARKGENTTLILASLLP